MALGIHIIVFEGFKYLKLFSSAYQMLSYQIFWQVGGLERGPLSLVITTEELLEKRNSGSGLENRD
jgi:hypothetical protein